MPEEPTFDYVFIDADKTRLPDLLRPRRAAARARAALLLLDNVFLGGAS